MLANREFFIIEAASQERESSEVYRIRIREENGFWRTAPVLTGTLAVRWFLNDKGVEDKQIALAIEELSRTGNVLVSGRPLKAA
jgi:hypothetical protein